MLENLITSKTRIKLLLKFFLNSKTTAYLRNLESEFGESTNAIRVELNRLEKAGLISAQMVGNKKVFQANTNHQLFSDIHNILLKHVGIDSIIEEVIKRMGNLQKAFIVGDLAQGKSAKVIDLIIIGNILNMDYLSQLVKKVERMIKLKVRFVAIPPHEEEIYLKEHEEALLIWSQDQ